MASVPLYGQQPDGRRPSRLCYEAPAIGLEPAAHDVDQSGQARAAATAVPAGSMQSRLGRPGWLSGWLSWRALANLGCQPRVVTSKI